MKIKLEYMFLILTIVILLFSITAIAFVEAKENENLKDDLERVDIIHYKNPNAGGKGGAKPLSCYKLMGVKWSKLPVAYVINPANPQGLSEGFVTSAISASAETWDDAISRELFNDVYAVNYTAQYGVQNFVNAVAFGDYPDNNVIAVTSVWFTRVGKQIVEFDQLFNLRFNWGDATLNPALMDLQNIATHELGHAVGLDDIYSLSCNGVTMYGYSSNGEISKRTLEQPDITGLQKMYGI